MRKPEQRLYDTMKTHCADGVRLERVENAVNTGMPDVHCIRRGVTVWIELKVVHRPARLSTPLIKSATMRRDQVAWHLSYTRAGGRSAILVRDDRRQLYLFDGALANILPQLTLAQCISIATLTDWAEFYREAFR